MSYTYLDDNCENSTSSPGLGEESSAESFADIPASALSKLNLTHEKFCYNASEMESCHVSPFGTMCEHSTANHGEGRLISCAEASRAKTSARQEKERVSKVQEAECGWKWHESFVKYHPDSSSWKTRQCSLLAGLDEFSETWPKWGMMQDGECWEQTPQGPVIIAPESGYVPTPCASDYKGGAKNGRDSEFKHWLKRRHGKSYPHPQRVEEMMLWPIGWSELAPLAMDRFHQWLDSHGKL